MNRVSPRIAAMLALVGLWAIVWPMGCGGEKPHTSRTAPPEKTARAIPAEKSDGVEQQLRELGAGSMTLQQKAGQLVMTKLDSATSDELRTIRRSHLGGVIVFKHNYTSSDALQAQITRAKAAGKAGSGIGVGLLVSADQEGGSVRAFEDQPSSIGAPELGGMSVRAVRQEGVFEGEALARLGVNMNLAPVTDLAIGPRRIMAGRSYGSDPVQVGERAAATVAGLQSARVAATPKHFPGFGAATENSDIGVAYVDRTRQQLRNNELRAFTIALRDADAVMISHGIYRGMGSSQPASLAPDIVRPLLRQQLRFTGVAITDSLNAKGLRDAWGKTVPQSCARAISIGVDIALVTGTMETARLCARRIADAVTRGDISQAQLDESLVRVLQLKRKLGLVPA